MVVHLNFSYCVDVVDKTVNISISQFNSVIADISNNTKRIIEEIARAEKLEVDLLIFPELTITGYLPLDLLYNRKMTADVNSAINQIMESINTEMVVIVGAPILVEETAEQGNKRYYNSAIVMGRNRKIKQVNKILLPNYSVFHEKRYFVSDINREDDGIFEFNGIKVGIQICEDMWSNMPFYQWGEYEGLETDVFKRLKQKEAELIINISASPYSKGKNSERLQIAKSHVKTHGIPFIYVNEVGALDEVVFDGGSFVLNSDAELVFAADPFTEGIYSFNSDQLNIIGGETFDNILFRGKQRELMEAIKLNLDVYLRNIGFKGKLLVAISGGIDSALTAALCVHTVGKDRVEGVYMPTRFSSDISEEDAHELAINLGIKLHTIPIDSIYTQAQITLEESIGERSWSVADENLQARIRGMMMMYLANMWNGLVISTGNKSEIAVGYCTLYGDTAGGKNLIGDLYKTEVYELAGYINDHYPELRIPDRSITRPPSAELREGQLDQDNLPEYVDLDRILEMMIDLRLSCEEIIEFGEDEDLVRGIAELVRNSEFKRDQLVQTVRVSDVSFGKGRLHPVATNFQE